MDDALALQVDLEVHTVVYTGWKLIDLHDKVAGMIVEIIPPRDE